MPLFGCALRCPRHLVQTSRCNRTRPMACRRPRVEICLPPDFRSPRVLGAEQARPELRPRLFRFARPISYMVLHDVRRDRQIYPFDGTIARTAGLMLGAPEIGVLPGDRIVTYSPSPRLPSYPIVERVCGFGISIFALYIVAIFLGQVPPMWITSCSGGPRRKLAQHLASVGARAVTAGCLWFCSLPKVMSTVLTLVRTIVYATIESQLCVRASSKRVEDLPRLEPVLELRWPGAGCRLTAFLMKSSFDKILCLAVCLGSIITCPIKFGRVNVKSPSTTLKDRNRLVTLCRYATDLIQGQGRGFP